MQLPAESLLNRLGYLTPLDPLRLDRAVAMGVGLVQLRLGPGFPMDPTVSAEATIQGAKALLESRGLRASAIGYYRNHLHPDQVVREADARGLRQVFEVAKGLDVDTIGVFAGRDPERAVDESLPDFVSVWRPLAEEAAERGLRLGFENCTMYRGYPVKGINMSHSPAAYRLMFEALPLPSVGMEFDPSHCLKQRIDPLRMIQEFGSRIFHVHLKDHEILLESVYEYGSFDPRTSRDRFPGFGSLDFRAMFTALRQVGYQGTFAIEGDGDPSCPDETSIRSALAQSVGHIVECAK